VRRGLRLRLALTHALVALLAIVVVAVIVTVVGGKRFDDYLAQVQRTRNDAVVSTLEQTYKLPDGWDATAVYTLSRIALINNVDVAVYSLKGQLLFTVTGRRADSGAMNGMTSGGGTTSDSAGAVSATPSPSVSLAPNQFQVRSVPVVVQGKQVATAEIYAPADLHAAAESAYQSALTRDLIVAAAVAAVLAFLISVLVSRRITAPLEELTDAAEDVSAGNLDVRVAPRANDEVGAIAQAFNSMADRLARDEQWRRDMTADLSHELRTPLATIQSRVEELEGGVLPPTPENLRVIGAEVERLGRLLGALRSLNELESEDLDVQHEPLDLAGVTADAIAGAETAFAGKRVALESHLSSATVRADRDRLLQVLANLLDNALKFTPAGGRVVVAVATAGAPGLPAPATAVLTVSDSGPGIDPIDEPFVFDRFYRSQAARDMRGVGLGLAIARGLVEAQGGTIDASGGEQGGAVFTVRLPAVDAPLSG